jgi:hypothetical protein
MKRRNLLLISIAGIFIILFTGCLQPIDGDGEVVPEKLRGLWINGYVAVAFNPATLSFSGPNGYSSPLYSVTSVIDTSIYVEDADGTVVLFANYTMPNSSSLVLSGGQTSGTAFAGTYSKSTD